jgi:hypothetical protein
MMGLKPVAEASSGHWVQTDGGRRTMPDDPRKVGALLDSLGLAYSLTGDDYAITALVSQSEDLIQAYRADINVVEHGKLFGYPETAIEAFVANPHQLLTPERQDEILKAAGLPDNMPMFRMSSAHWEDEIKILQDWHQALRQAGLV